MLLKRLNNTITMPAIMLKKLVFLSVVLTVVSFRLSAEEARIVSYNNPDLTVDLGVGLWAIPIPMDYDHDGVNDLLVNCPDTPYKGIWFFRNIGTNEEPLFDEAQRLCKKASQNICSSFVGDSVCIIDAGKALPDFFNSWFEKPEKIRFSGGDFIPGVKKNRSNMWSYTDWDGDGDYDIVVGYDTWDDYGWDNAFDAKGNWTNGPLRGFVFLLENVDGKYVNKGKLQAGGKAIETFGAPNPCVADFDGDGDLDIICGEFIDGFTYYENIGTRTEPLFAAGRTIENSRGDLRLHLQMIVPRPFDFDGDGNMDLIVGDEDGRVAFVRNTGRQYKGMPEFESPVYFRQKADALKFGALATPCSYDWDGDGDEDIITGNSAGEIAFIENLSKAGDADPVWAEPVLMKVKGKPLRIMAGENGSIQGPAESKWGYTVLSVADWDGDGKADLIVNSIYGKIEWYRNAGAEDNLSFEKARPVKVAWEGVAPKPAWNWWSPKSGEFATQWRTSPAVIDWNGDGINDIVMLDHEGYLAFFEGTKAKGETILKPGKRIFHCTNGSLYRNRKGMIDPEPGLLRMNEQEAGASGRRKICFTDWDCDGRIDLIVDGKNAVFFRNVRTQDGETWFEYRGDLSDTRLEGHTTCPTPVDWNGDNVHDILVGAEDGHFYILENPLTVNPDTTISLYNGTVPSEERIDSRGYIWDITDSELLVYLPEKDKATGEAVLVVPGGSYAKNCITYEGYRTAKWLNNAGIAAFILKYRLPDGNPDVILEDGRAAIETIRKNAEKFGVNPDEIGVMGFSAGGHFSATLLTQYGSVSARPDFGILVYPVISSEYDNAATFANLLGDNAGAAGHEWDADRNVHENMPPVMIVGCGDDKAVPPAQWKAFYEAAVAKDVKIQMHLYPEGGHGFWMRDRYRYGDETYPMIISWIKNNNK